MVEVPKTSKVPGIARYLERKPIILEPDIVPVILSAISIDGFGHSVDVSGVEVTEEVQIDHSREYTCSRSGDKAIKWDKKYTVSNIPGFSGNLVVYAFMRQVPIENHRARLTTREQFEEWCRKKRSLVRRQDNYMRKAKAKAKPGEGIPLPNELFGNVFNPSAPETGILVDSLEDTELKTADVLRIVVCYDGLDIHAVEKDFILSKIVDAAKKRFAVNVDLRLGFGLYGFGFAQGSTAFFVRTGSDVTKAISNVFKAGTAVERSIKKYEQSVADPIIEQFD